MTRASILLLVVLLVGAGILLLVGPGLYKGVEVAESVVQTYDGAPTGAPGARRPAPPSPPPLPPAPSPSTRLAGGASPPAPAPPSEAQPPPEPSATDRPLLEAALAMREETLRIHRVLYAAGRVTEGQVDDAELAVVDARHDLGGLEGPAWHRARAAILARRAEQAERAAAAGQLPQDDADLASLALELERALAGDPSAYAWTRDAVLSRSARRRRELVGAGRLLPSRAREADLANERRFPVLPIRAPSGR